MHCHVHMLLIHRRQCKSGLYNDGLIQLVITFVEDCKLDKQVKSTYLEMTKRSKYKFCMISKYDYKCVTSKQFKSSK